MTQREHASTPAANAQADILLAELERSRAEFERAERAARSYLAGHGILDQTQLDVEAALKSIGVEGGRAEP
jgi:uncharacterized protein involved in exopolysaccharide biosynthesis